MRILLCLQDSEINGGLEWCRDARDRGEESKSMSGERGARSKFSQGHPQPPPDQFTERADSVGSENGLLGVPPTMEKGLCAWFRHVLRAWEIAPFGEPGKAHPIPLASVQSTQATCSWLIPFPQFPNLEVDKRVAWRAGRNHLSLRSIYDRCFYQPTSMSDTTCTPGR